MEQTDSCRKGCWGHGVKDGEGLTKERVRTTPGHTQQFGDWLGVKRRGERGKVSKNNGNSINNKNKIKKNY